MLRKGATLRRDLVRRAIKLLCAAPALVVILSGCASGLEGERVAVPDAQDAIVVYGGLGFLDARAQPQLARITTGGAAGAEAEVARRAYEAAVGVRLPEVSDQPVVGTDEGFAAALAAKSGRDPADVRGLDLRDEIDGTDILVLSLIGSLEQEYAVPGGGGRAQKNVGLFTVTAVLSRPVSGEILLSADHTARIDVTATAGEQGTMGLLPQAYAAAAEGAVRELGFALEDYGTARGDKVMVTGVAFEAPFARQVTGARPTPWRNDGPCVMADPCPEGPGGDACRKMQGAITQVATDALRANGYNTLPPWRWAAWGDVAADNAGVTVGTLRMPTTGGWSKLDDRLTLVLEPSEAQDHVVVVVKDHSSWLEPNRSGRLQLRHYETELAMPVFRAPYGASCELARLSDEIRGVAKRDAFMNPEEPNVAGRDLPPELERSYLVLMSRRSLGQGA